jgi:hypothetical protein
MTKLPEKPCKYAIQLAHDYRYKTTDTWNDIRARLGQDGARAVFRIVRDNVVIDPLAFTGDRRWALELLARHNALESWAGSGFPIVIFDLETAVALANTDPPGALLSSPHGGNEHECLCLVVDRLYTRLITNWRNSESLEIIDPDRPLDDPPFLFVDENLSRLITNVGFALLERPVGIRISEIRPTPQQMIGREFYPGVAYILQTPRPPRTASERSADYFFGRRPRSRRPLGVRTAVRGHWRLQACGPQFSQHKIIWIQPTWRGPADAPISIHATEIMGVRR